MQGRVKVSLVGPDPGMDVGRAICAARGVDVDTADDAVAAAGPDGVGETCPLREVLGVPPQVGEVAFEGQPGVRPGTAAELGGAADIPESGRGPDVIDAS